MKIDNRHQRHIAAPPDRVAGIIAQLDGVWPTRIARLGRWDAAATTRG